MKKVRYITLLFVIYFGFTNNSKAQLGVTDAALNKKLMKQLENNGKSLMYEQIKKKIAEGLLMEAEDLATKVKDKYKIYDDVFKTNSELKGFKKIENSYKKANAVDQTISYVLNYIASAKPNEIPEVTKREIKKAMGKALDDMKLANETIDYALADKNKLSLKERIAQLDEADLKLENASLKIAKSVTFIKQAKFERGLKNKNEHYYNLKYQ